ncbi:hypothetical protein CIPAW_10G119500 [Carya illinoinensis]|uniref:Uncharacterized protein n=1 Tax=Carya illinoinensis TaxID=32201 RepID=A0A8T1P6V4_CARIL|nr:hypothetical protein CIPAW_10G119500 [Carya illinoinensis]
MIQMDLGESMSNNPGSSNGCALGHTSSRLGTTS